TAKNPAEKNPPLSLPPRGRSGLELRCLTHRPAMLHTSTQKLIQKLCELTEQGDINWREGENGETLFDTEGYVVELKGAPPGLRVLRADGRELERADPADLAAAKW